MLGGGKFANGAVSATFVVMFNHWVHVGFNDKQLKMMFSVYRKSVDYYATPKAFYESIGGPLGIWAAETPEEFKNTCAARLSKALNYSDFEIPKGTPETYLGGDGKYYFIQAKAMKIYLSNKVWGNSVQAESIYHVKNAVIFQTGFSRGVTGHLDVVYRGNTASYHSYNTSTYYWH